MARVYSTFPEGYELIDAGGGRKLERWGKVVTIRPEHQAYFSPSLTPSEWNEHAGWEFLPDRPGSLNGKWKQLAPGAPDVWELYTEGFSARLSITGNKHIGLFPEQQYNWQFIRELLNPSKRFLNLFAYTGAASVAGRSTGAEVTHVDSVRAMIDWARQNMELSGLSDIRWVVEDARKFVNRELKRGNRYDLVQMDPPAWGLGAKGEKWKLEELLPDLLQEASELLLPGGTLIVNTYSPKLDENALRELVKALPGQFSGAVDELWMETTHGKQLFYGLIARIRRKH